MNWCPRECFDKSISNGQLRALIAKSFFLLLLIQLTHYPSRVGHIFCPPQLLIKLFSSETFPMLPGWNLSLQQRNEPYCQPESSCILVGSLHLSPSSNFSPLIQGPACRLQHNMWKQHINPSILWFDLQCKLHNVLLAGHSYEVWKQQAKLPILQICFQGHTLDDVLCFT